MDIIIIIATLDSYKIKVIPGVAEYISALRERMYMNSYLNFRYSLRPSTATPAFSMHGICNPITCNVGLHTRASEKPPESTTVLLQYYYAN